MRATLAIVFCLPLVLTGCELTSSNAPTADPGVAIQGSVHGGQQPIVGARVYLLAAGTGGYGGQSSSLLLATGANTVQDKFGGATNNDYYVTTGAGGAFTISNDYSCTPTTQVYLYAVGGDPGLGTGANAASGLMAALGKCPSSGNFLTSTTPIPYIVINEVSTVAAAYSFAGFATDPTHVSSANTTLALTGVQNAFANAANLAGIGSGAALATTPSGGVAPQGTVYTLANILGACVNSNGATTGPTNPTACYTLFTNATSDGTPTGAQPSDTATAAINIAHHPGVNIDNLWGLVPGVPAFGSGLTSEPNDFTLGIQYTSGGVNAPNFIAIDGIGNAWITNSGASSVSELSSNGTAVSPAGGYTGGSIDGLSSVAIDLAGNAWIANDHLSGGSVVELSSGDTLVSGSTGYTVGNLTSPYGIAIDASNKAWVTNSLNSSVSVLSGSGLSITGVEYTDSALSTPHGIAIDQAGAAWIANNAGNSVTKLSGLGAVLSGPNGFTDPSLNSPDAIAIDHSGNAWITNSANSSVTKFSSTGTILSGSGYTGGGLNNPNAIAIDGSGSAWVANLLSQSVTQINNAGTIVSGANGYSGGNVDLPDAIAIDGSGNVWIGNLGGEGITELIGAATPVVTPLASGVANNSLGSRP
jgi:streptogramin lyase